MIIKALVSVIFLVLRGAIGLLPTFSNYDEAPKALFTMLSTAFQFFPSDVFVIALGSIIFWITVNIVFGGIKFVVNFGKH